MSALKINALGQHTTKFKPECTLSIGYPGHLFDFPERGFHLGINPAIIMRSRLSLESQLSYAFAGFKRDDHLFSHDGGYIKTLNLLIGPRFYLASPDRVRRPYLNVLFGAAYQQEEVFTFGNDLVKYKEWQGSIGISGFAPIGSRFLGGISLEGPYLTLVVKLGIKLN